MQAHSAIISEKPLATPMGLGMILFLISESFLFASLFIIYYYLRGYSLPHWPPAGVEVHLNVSTINTFVLLSSSLTVYLAVRAARRGNTSRLAVWLASTMLLGSVFIAIKLYEWATNSFGPWDHAYGSIYYTLTGLHALHVLIGLGILSALLGRTLAGRFSAQRHSAVELGSLYWHFVDLVWIFVFSTIYLVR